MSRRSLFQQPDAAVWARRRSARGGKRERACLDDRWREPRAVGRSAGRARSSAVFGSEIETPTIDGLAQDGLRFNAFHVTALCSPTRACLLTGRNHHAVGMGLFPEIPGAARGYSGRLPNGVWTLAAALRNAGYNTFAVGKWHLIPRGELSASGPFTRSPLGLGFERYYGFLGAEANQWSPTLVADNHAIPAPANVGNGYHLTEDLADQAFTMIRDQQQATPGKPFFLYFATAAPHAPHHVARQVRTVTSTRSTTTVSSRAQPAPPRCTRTRVSCWACGSGRSASSSGSTGRSAGSPVPHAEVQHRR
jgi:arylsulfatase A-like enzyme